MKKKIFLITLFFFLFLTVQRAQAYISTTPLKDELGSPEFQAGSNAFNNVCDIADSLTILMRGTDDEQINSQLGASAVEVTGNLIAAMYAHPPASSVEYFADLGKRLDIVRPAYAQGVGFEGLKPILPIWKAFRNVAYLFFTIVFVIMGFAIMFRLKLDPQTVISIQSAIPRVIIALILVTFSYAIAGLLIDLMYVVSAIGVAVINPGGILYKIIDFLETNFGLGGGAESPNLLVFLILFMGKGAGYAAILSRLLNPATLIAELANVPGGIVTVIQVLTAPTYLGIGSTLLNLILTVILLYVFFKLFLSLLKAYISIIISVLFGPLQIMFNVIPGQNSFGGWIRNLIANLAVFPAVILMMALTAKIVEVSEGGQLWMPPVIRPPLLAGSPTRIVTAMIAYGMLLLIPKVADMVKEALQVKPFPYGAAIGEAFGPVSEAARFGYTAGKIETGRLLVKAPPRWAARIPTRWREAIGTALGYRGGP